MGPRIAAARQTDDPPDQRSSEPRQICVATNKPGAPLRAIRHLAQVGHPSRALLGDEEIPKEVGAKDNGHEPDQVNRANVPCGRLSKNRCSVQAPVYY
jgi:hypothetical protein